MPLGVSFQAPQQVNGGNLGNSRPLPLTALALNRHCQLVPFMPASALVEAAWCLLCRHSNERQRGSSHKCKWGPSGELQLPPVRLLHIQCSQRESTGSLFTFEGILLGATPLHVLSAGKPPPICCSPLWQHPAAGSAVGYTASWTSSSSVAVPPYGREHGFLGRKQNLPDMQVADPGRQGSAAAELRNQLSGPALYICACTCRAPRMLPKWARTLPRGRTATLLPGRRRWPRGRRKWRRGSGHWRQSAGTSKWVGGLPAPEVAPIAGFFGVCTGSSGTLFRVIGGTHPHAGHQQ